MSARFTRMELAQLLGSVLSLKEEDSGVLLPIAVKACASANAPVREVLWQTFELITIPHRSTLRVWFKTLARVGQLEGCKRGSNTPRQRFGSQ